MSVYEATFVSRIDGLDGYERLVAAIMKQAVEDYIGDLYLYYSNGRLPKHEKAVKNDERFFLSDYGQTLSGGQGAVIIELAQKEYFARKEAEEKERLKAMYPDNT